MKKRIIGIDVARAFAIIGMIIVNFKIVFGEHGNQWLSQFVHIFDGKAAATFVVLAGVGIAFMSNSALKDKNSKKLKSIKLKIFKRAVFLFVIGLSYIWIWPADILHFYGIYMLITLLFISSNSKKILFGVAALILLFPILIIFFNYETGWNFNTLEYLDFWSLNGFFRNLFFNGFHPVIPWTGFMLFGLWYGKQDLNSDYFVKKSLRVSLIVLIIIQVISYLLLYNNGNEHSIIDMTPFFGTDPMPPLPFYMINGISISVAIISACILISKKYKTNFIINSFKNTGQLALTFYVAHVIIGMGLVEELGYLQLGEYSIEFSVIYAITFSIFCIIFANIWLKYFNTGPLEWIMRKLTDI